METKSGIKTSELMALIAGIVAAIAPVLLDKLPAESVGYVIVSCLAAVAAYILGRSYVKGATLKANALVAASQPADPPKPPSP